MVTGENDASSCLGCAGFLPAVISTFIHPGVRLSHSGSGADHTGGVMFQCFLHVYVVKQRSSLLTGEAFLFLSLSLTFDVCLVLFPSISSVSSSVSV